MHNVRALTYQANIKWYPIMNTSFLKSSPIYTLKELWKWVTDNLCFEEEDEEEEKQKRLYPFGKETLGIWHTEQMKKRGLTIPEDTNFFDKYNLRRKLERGRESLFAESSPFVYPDVPKVFRDFEALKWDLLEKKQRKKLQWWSRIYKKKKKKYGLRSSKIHQWKRLHTASDYAIRDAFKEPFEYWHTVEKPMKMAKKLDVSNEFDWRNLTLTIDANTFRTSIGLEPRKIRSQNHDPCITCSQIKDT